MQQNQATLTPAEAAKKAAKILYEASAYLVDFSDSATLRTRAQQQANDTFQFGMPGAEAWVLSNASKLDLSQADAYKYLSKLGQALEYNGQTDTERSQNAFLLLERSAALAYQQGEDTADVVEAFTEALSGNTSSLDVYHFNIASASEDGGNLSNIIIDGIKKETYDAWNDFNSEEARNLRATSTFNAELENLKANVGDFVQPAVSYVAGLGADALGFVNSVVQSESDLAGILDGISEVGTEEQKAVQSKAQDAKSIMEAMRDLENQDTYLAQKEYEILSEQLRNFNIPGMTEALELGTDAIDQCITAWELAEKENIRTQELQAKANTLSLLEQSIIEAKAQSLVDEKKFPIQTQETFEKEFALIKEHTGLQWDGTPEGLDDMAEKGADWLSDKQQHEFNEEILAALQTINNYSNEMDWAGRFEENQSRVDFLTELYAQYAPQHSEWLTMLSETNANIPSAGVLTEEVAAGPESTVAAESEESVNDPAIQEVLMSLESFLAQMPELSTNLSTTDTALAESVNNLVGISTTLDALCISLNSAIQNIPATIATMAPIQVYCSGGAAPVESSNPESLLDDFITGVKTVVSGVQVILDGQKVGQYAEKHIFDNAKRYLNGRV